MDGDGYLLFQFVLLGTDLVIPSVYFFLLGFASVGAEHGHDCVLLELDILGVATRRLQLPRNTQVICPH